jgi:hypothetical protein
MEYIDIELKLREIDNLKEIARKDEDWDKLAKLEDEEIKLLMCLGDN